VTVATVAVDIDHDVATEALTVVHRQAHGLCDCLGIFTIHVEHRATQHAREIGAVARGTRVVPDRGEADLIVDHHVHGAAAGIAAQLREVERLCDHALADERGVAVDQHGQHFLALFVAAPILLRAHATFDDGIHELQVTRVERQSQVDVVTVGHHAIRRITEVVLHVAATEQRLRVVVFERGEDLFEILLHHVYEHIQAPAVRHADHELFHAVLTGAVDHQLQQGDDALRALEREALGTDVLRMQELLEDLSVDQLGEDPHLLFVRELDAVLRGLHPLLQPGADLGLFDVAILDADAAAIRLLQALHELFERELGGTCEVARGE
jgi:hypothetical protein